MQINGSLLVEQARLSLSLSLVRVFPRKRKRVCLFSRRKETHAFLENERTRGAGFSPILTNFDQLWPVLTILTIFDHF